MNRRDFRVNLLAKLRRQTAPDDDSVSGRGAPRASAAAGEPESQQAPDLRWPGAVPAPLPRRLSDRAGRQRRNPPRVQRPDEQVLAHLARVLPRL